MRGATTHIFHNKDNLCISFNGIIKVGNIRMIKPSHKFDFTSYRLLPLQILHLLFLVDFKGHFLVIAFVNTDMDSRISTLSDLFAYYIVIHGVIF